MKVLGLISSPADPASQARIMQFASYFKPHDIHLHCKYFTPLKDADPKKWNYRLKKFTGVDEWRSSDFVKSIGRIPLLLNQSGFDLIWQNRLLQIKHSFWEKKLTKPVVFDFDDAIWLNEGQEQVSDKIRRSDIVFAGNEYLADFARNYSKNVFVIPTVVDTKKLFPIHKDPKEFVLGWIGTRSNFKYLETIREQLLGFVSQNENAYVMIVSSEMPAFLQGHARFLFKEWSPGNENELINNFSAGIMPLPDDEWTRGKCGYKLLQYLSCGIPVIASSTGVNKRIVTDSGAGLLADSPEQWKNALVQLSDDASSTSMGEKGRDYIVNNFSCEAWTPTIIQHFKSLQ